MLNRGLIVSCQACENEPLYGYGIMNLMAKAAVAGGACGIRALYYDVESIKNTVNVPVIGLVKQSYANSEIYITPTKKKSISFWLLPPIASRWTPRCAPPERRNAGRTGCLCAAYAPGYGNHGGYRYGGRSGECRKTGVRLYFHNAPRLYERNEKRSFAGHRLYEKVVKTIKKSKVIAEGGIFERAEIRKISKINPYAVVIGSSITRPAAITARFVKNLSLR